jgi:protein TonB
MIHVAPDGSVASVDVEQSSGYPLLDQAAVKAIRGWHFLPAMRDGSGVPSEMPMRVVFQAS